MIRALLYALFAALLSACVVAPYADRYDEGYRYRSYYGYDHRDGYGYDYDYGGFRHGDHG